MPKLQAGCTLTAQDGMVVRTAQTSPGRRRRAELDARVHPRQPPARLPRLRQGRRVPAPGPHLPLGPAGDAEHVPEAHVREADPDLADDRARPRALHPLLPLHAVLLGRRRGQPARRARPRLAVGDRHLRGRALPGAVLGQRDRALPRRRADVHPVPLRGPALGDPGRPDRLRPLPGRLQHRVDHARGQGEADRLAQPPRGRRGLALRQGPLRVRAPPRRGPSRRPAATVGPAPLRGALLGRRPGRGRGAAARRGPEHRHRAVRLRDDRAGLRARQAPARGDRRALRRHAGGREPGARRLPPAALGDPGRGADRRPRRRPRRRASSDRRPLAARGPESGRRHRHDSDRHSRPRRRRRPGRRAGLPAPGERARDPDLVGTGRPGRRDGRRARGRARVRREARLRRLPAPRDGKRARRRRRVGCRGRRRGRRPRADRAADRLRRRGRGEPGRPGAGRARLEGARDLDVPLARSPAGPTSSSPARATSSATAPT